MPAALYELPLVEVLEEDGLAKFIDVVEVVALLPQETIIKDDITIKQIATEHNLFFITLHGYSI